MEHTSAKLIKIKLKYLSKRQALHESGGEMESNDIPHWSWVRLFLLGHFSLKFMNFFKQKDHPEIYSY